ncbi:MAG: sigma-54-dependent Fis family transcriptional regulator [Proteobacteria bacterium]|nr:MAG: sigma-54-dependent Fis family transcriptional regulator [Pseudomonadota bacterium]
MKTKILVIDDEASFRESLEETLADFGFEAVGVASAEEALELSLSDFLMAFIDFELPGMNGLEGLASLKKKTKDSLPVVVLTAHLDSANTIEAMKLGAFDHLTKPVSRASIEKVVAEIRALRMSAPSSETSSSKPFGQAADQQLIARSPAMRDVLKAIGRLSNSDATVLITGETGSGKELVARSLHSSSARASKPMIAINCAAIPETLLESELFGSVRGAFTGASADRKGAFQHAQGGTLFLDEIGDMSLPLQAKLLRALQEREIVQVGSAKPISIDVRFIAATHQNLERAVEAKLFRQDLFYRLNVVQISLPSLRDRPEDIQPLAESFLRVHAGKQPKHFSTEALQKLSRYAFPGNVRELQNIVERSSIMSKGAVIEESEITLGHEQPASGLDQETLKMSLPDAVESLERRMILSALDGSSWNRSEAARKLGIQRQLLYTKMRAYNIVEPLS